MANIRSLIDQIRGSFGPLYLNDSEAIEQLLIDLALAGRWSGSQSFESETSKTYNHGLGTREVLLQLIDSSHQTVNPLLYDATRGDNSITIEWGAAVTGTYTLVVISAEGL